jgi:signal transduction histidine kinase
MFSHEDLALLETLSNQTAIAIENATLYEDLKKSEAFIRRADRLAALGTLTAGLAHEIRNPMVAIKTFVQLLPERFDDSEFMDHFLQVTSDEVERICVLVNELLEFSRPADPNFQKEDINEIARKMILLVENEASKKNIVISKKYGRGLPFILIDKEQVKQVLLNLFLNAIDAIKEEGLITFKTRLINKSNSKNYVQIEIGDNGDGISKDDLERIFTPFFTKKDTGSGLGLSISYKIIQEHSGFIEVESKVGEGTTFYVDLPLSPDKGSVANGINRGVVNRSERC